MSSATPPKQFVIRGLTVDGKTFRPSDWAERLAGAMSSFRPGAVGAGISAYIGYSPYCVPQLEGSVKSVLVSEALKGLEPMAWDFVMNFARDNQLQVLEEGGRAGKWRRPNDKGPQKRALVNGGSACQAAGAASASALTLAASRLFRRAALFL